MLPYRNTNTHYSLEELLEQLELFAEGKTNKQKSIVHIYTEKRTYTPNHEDVSYYRKYKLTHVRVHMHFFNLYFSSLEPPDTC